MEVSRPTQCPCWQVSLSLAVVISHLHPTISILFHKDFIKNFLKKMSDSHADMLHVMMWTQASNIFVKAEDRLNWNSI